MNAKYLMGGLLLSSLFFTACEKKEKETSTAAPADTSAISASSTAPSTVIAQELSGKAHIMKDGEYVETQIKNVDYYLLYFTASW